MHCTSSRIAWMGCASQAWPSAGCSAGQRWSPVHPGYKPTSPCPWAGTGAATRWCSHSCRVVRGCTGCRSTRACWCCGPACGGGPSHVLGRKSAFGAAIWCNLAARPARADSAVASGMRASNTKGVVRSTSKPTEDLLTAPLTRSPSQWSGMSRAATSGGRTWMLTISGIWPRRSGPAKRGRRVLRSWRRHVSRALRLALGVRVDGVVDRLVRDV